MPIIREGEHLIGAFVGDVGGPTLIVVGGLHGNERAGPDALIVLADKVKPFEEHLRGRVYLVAGNTRALEKRVRFIDCDLNRAWTRENLAAVGRRRVMRMSEGCELTELDRLFDCILINARSEVYVLDLHSTSAKGAPFATVGDTLRNRTFAQKFPVTILLGIEENLDGTMLEYLNNAGAVTLGFEGGSHLAPETVANHLSLAWLALINAGLLDASEVGDLEKHRSRLAAEAGRHRIVEVRYREAITADDKFEMLPGFNNFDRVTKGQVLAASRFGPVRSREDGLILMPLYQSLGEDGFFIGRVVAPFWLLLSKWLRKLRVQNLLSWLPGVSRHPREPDTLIVNIHVARIFPLQIFHLLGYRRRRLSADKLIVSRRRHDIKSPFGNAVV
jgi:succinylglutamate desuccinylase